MRDTATLALWTDAQEGDLQADNAANCLQAWAPDAWSVASDWGELVRGYAEGDAGRTLGAFLNARLRDGAIIYPPQPLRALALTPLDQVRVVVLGQDPYHGPGQAEGLAFSVPRGVRLPPSLRNILQEVAREENRADLPEHGSLTHWAGQGVLLLNTSLTVEQGQPGSHAGRGWEALTDALIQTCSRNGSPKAFLLWGAHAQAKEHLIDGDRHLVLKANHPSPLSARRPPVPFVGCGHFGRVNAWLAERNEKPVRWFAEPEKSMA